MKPIGFIVPAQPTAAKAPPSGPGWLHEIKYDGFRLMALRKHHGVRLLTRNGHDWTDRYPAVAEAIRSLRLTSCTIDGEIAMCDDRGLAVFDLLRHGERVKHEAVLFAFDLVELDGEDYRWRPLETRKRALAALTANVAAGLQLVEHLHGDGAVIYEHACRLGAEGIVSKRIGSRYQPGPRRCSDWIKIKNPMAPAVRREAEEEWGTRGRPK